MKGPTAPKDPGKTETVFLYYTGQRSIRGKNAGWQGNPVYL